MNNKKKLLAALLCLLCLVLCGCAQRVEFANGKLPVDSESIAWPLVPGETELLSQLPQLRYADFSGSENFEEIISWSEKNPQVEVKYTVTFPDGTVAENSCRQLDLSGLKGEDAEKAAALMEYLPELESLTLLPGEFTPAQVLTLSQSVKGVKTQYSYELGGQEIDFYAESVDLSGMDSSLIPRVVELLPQLPELKSVDLGSDKSSKLSWEDIYTLVHSCPELEFEYDFSVYGKDFSLSDSEMDLNHTTVEDGAVQVYQAARCMKKLEYLDMDFCGVPNETMEKLRDALPDVKVVWRIWFGSVYSVRTDVEKILASKASQGMLGDRDVQVLKYCTDLKYLDLGHNEYISDLSFASFMPKLEVLIVAINDVVDISPLANCPELEYLELQTNEALGDLSPLANCKKLAHLNVVRCRNVEDISPLYGLDKLERFWLGSGNRVSREQIEEFSRLHPDCQFNTTAFSDPTGDGWRLLDYDIMTGKPTYSTRYALLLEQFGYLEYDYSYSWKDPKYEAGGDS